MRAALAGEADPRSVYWGAMAERLVVDRYELVAELASGGMATVYLGRVRGAVGFSRTVAIKRLHKQYAREPAFVAMFLDEARLASRIRHPNVVPTLDVVSYGGELFLVMEYVHGEALSAIVRALRATSRPIPLPIAGAIASGMLLGLHAAHDTTDQNGRPLDIVHRDISPQNVLVGADGIVRLVDFGIAKAAGRLQSTTDGAVKGKAGYMSPEQLEGNVDRRCDLYATSVVLWEMLAGRRLFQGESHAHVVTKVLAGNVPPLRSVAPEVPLELDDVVMCGLELSPDRRFSTAREMERALRRAAPVAAAFDVAEWLESAMGASLRQRAAELSRVEATSLGGVEADGASAVRPTPPELDATTEAPTTRPAWPLRGWRPASVAMAAVALAAISASAAFVVGTRQAPPRVIGDPAVPFASPHDPGAVFSMPAIAEPSAPASPDAEAPSPPLGSSFSSGSALFERGGPSTASSASPSATTASAPAASANKRVPHPSRAPRASCSPPYFVNAEGHKIFRVECL
jgi:serine/threonine-protein kinase